MSDADDTPEPAFFIFRKKYTGNLDFSCHQNRLIEKASTLNTKTYIFPYFSQQYLVLFTMVPRYCYWHQKQTHRETLLSSPPHSLLTTPTTPTLRRGQSDNPPTRTGLPIRAQEHSTPNAPLPSPPTSFLADHHRHSINHQLFPPPPPSNDFSSNQSHPANLPESTNQPANHLKSTNQPKPTSHCTPSAGRTLSRPSRTNQPESTIHQPMHQPTTRSQTIHQPTRVNQPFSPSFAVGAPPQPNNQVQPSNQQPVRVNQPTNHPKSINQPINRSTTQPISLLAYQPTRVNQPTNCPNQSIDRSINQPISLLIYQPTNQPQSTNHFQPCQLTNQPTNPPSCPRSSSPARPSPARSAREAPRTPARTPRRAS